MWQYYRDEPALDNNCDIANFLDNIVLFKSKLKISRKTPNDGNTKVSWLNLLNKRFYFYPYTQKLLTPKDNLLNKTTPETINLFSKNIFKLPQETLVKRAIDNYIKKITVGFVNESYFLYDESNVVEQTFITEINKFTSIYGSITYFNKKKSKWNSANNFV